MLLWLNGPFGGGKTHVAAEISYRLAGTWVADPEAVGSGLQAMLPKGIRGDFQDMPAWRVGVIEALDTVLARHDGLVIAPQTLVHPDYFEEILGSLRGRGYDVRHVTLMARPETVRQRLRDRALGRVLGRLGVDTLARESFAAERLEPYLERLKEPQFAEHIWTDDTRIGEVAEAAAATCGLTLDPVDEGAVRTAMRRARTTVRHMRFI